MTEYITPANIEFINNIIEEIIAIKNSFETDPNNEEHKANYVKLIKMMLFFRDIDDDEISKRVDVYMMDEGKQELTRDQNQEPNQEPKQEPMREDLPNYFKIQNNFMIEKIYDDITEKNNFRRNFEFTILEDMEDIILCVYNNKN